MERRLLTTLFVLAASFCLVFVAVAYNNSDKNSNGNEHTHDLHWIEAKSASCTEGGNIEHWYCNGCDKYFADEEATTELTVEEIFSSATGHTKGVTEIVNEVEATCTIDGSYVKVTYCADCGEEMSSEIITVGTAAHSYYTSWTYSDSWHWRECVECGEITDNALHTTSNNICTVCGYEVSGTDGLEYTLSDDRTYYTVTGIGTASDTDIVIPSIYNNLPVVSIMELAFWNCSSITSIIIGSGVKTIGDYAFSGCTSLTKISVDAINEYYCDIDDVLFSKDETQLIAYPAGKTAKSYIIPDSVTAIGSDAFYGCNSLTSIAIADSVIAIGEQAFRNCTSLECITIPEGITYIGDWAFYGCKSLTEIYVDANNQYYCDIDGVLFSKNKTQLVAYPAGKAIKSYIIPDSVSSINSAAFYGCSSLTSITIPEGVTSIGGFTFSYCSLLISINILEGVTSIGDSAFYGCSSLTSITISDDVTTIGSFAFYGCSSLTSITIPESVITIGSFAFYGCSSLTSITIPDNATTIGSFAFSDCSSLTSINILDSVTSIGSYAFYGCSLLESVTIGNSVSAIGDSAFYNCRSLKSVYYRGTEENWGSITIGSGNKILKNATIYYYFENEKDVPTDGGNYWHYAKDGVTIVIWGSDKD